MITDSRDSLRSSMRILRRKLPVSVRKSLSRKAALHCHHWPVFNKAKRIGFYWPINGETSPLPIMNLARRMGKSCWLPVIRPWAVANLGFAEIGSNRRLVRHRWGFYEPRGRRLFDAGHLDMLIIPLTAFDVRGNRLGMGGGYYDRALRKLRRKKPVRVGLAFDFQQTALLMHKPWDIPLDAVLTPGGVIRCSKRRQP